jgi:hypothetical protein
MSSVVGLLALRAFVRRWPKPQNRKDNQNTFDNEASSEVPVGD